MKVGEVVLVALVVLVAVLVIDMWVNQRVELKTKANLGRTLHSPRQTTVQGFASGAIVACS